ncbi:MAG: hypothetical protein KC442_03490 [Thermomicrobiales bacterium]|nr:hypothetical protein [Thermomicrobiales bacterium]
MSTPAGSDPFRLDGRVTLVTGGARGLGQAMAVALALDLSAPFLLSQALARQLVAREAPGKIVNVASRWSPYH